MAHWYWFCSFKKTIKLTLFERVNAFQMFVICCICVMLLSSHQFPWVHVQIRCTFAFVRILTSKNYYIVDQVLFWILFAVVSVAMRATYVCYTHGWYFFIACCFFDRQCKLTCCLWQMKCMFEWFNHASFFFCSDNDESDEDHLQTPFFPNILKLTYGSSVYIIRVETVLFFYSKYSIWSGHCFGHFFFCMCPHVFLFM